MSKGAHDANNHDRGADGYIFSHGGGSAVKAPPPPAPVSPGLGATGGNGRGRSKIPFNGVEDAACRGWLRRRRGRLVAFQFGNQLADRHPACSTAASLITITSAFGSPMTFRRDRWFGTSGRASATCGRRPSWLPRGGWASAEPRRCSIRSQTSRRHRTQS